MSQESFQVHTDKLNACKNVLTDKWQSLIDLGKKMKKRPDHIAIFFGILVKKRFCDIEYHRRDQRLTPSYKLRNNDGK